MQGLIKAILVSYEHRMHIGSIILLGYEVTLPWWNVLLTPRFSLLDITSVELPTSGVSVLLLVASSFTSSCVFSPRH